MLWPMSFCCPALFWTLAGAATARHAMAGMDPLTHRALMRLVYGL
jgi:hypothetical protein